MHMSTADVGTGVGNAVGEAVPHDLLHVGGLPVTSLSQIPDDLPRFQYNLNIIFLNGFYALLEALSRLCGHLR